ncbi:MAG: SDR family oxidoreductase [Actinomycetota bacterium]
MDLGLEGKVVWVTGASSGLGRATAESLAREGATVAASARRAELLEEVVTGLATPGRAFPLDVTDERAVYDSAATIESDLGPIEVLVANAGGPPPGTFETTGDDDFRAGYALTLESAWHLVRAVTPNMARRGHGVVIFITSWSTKEVIEGLFLSNVMRAAVMGMAKSMSKDLGPKGIRVLCIAPGRIATERIEELDDLTAQRTGSSVEDVRDASEARVPLGRYGRPEEIADVIAFLASERASYMSGTTVVVDGGQLNMTGA